jgi:hypothetical protein
MPFDCSKARKAVEESTRMQSRVSRITEVSGGGEAENLGVEMFVAGAKGFDERWRDAKRRSRRILETCETSWTWIMNRVLPPKSIDVRDIFYFLDDLRPLLELCRVIERAEMTG